MANLTPAERAHKLVEDGKWAHFLEPDEEGEMDQWPKALKWQITQAIREAEEATALAEREACIKAIRTKRQPWLDRFEPFTESRDDAIRAGFDFAIDAIRARSAGNG